MEEDDKLVVLDPKRVAKRADGRGRKHQPVYSAELAVEICRVIGASDLSIETLCKTHAHWPSVQALYNWRQQHVAFAQGFGEAEAMRASRFMHQCVEIADDTSRDVMQIGDGKFIPNNAAVTRDRLRIETRREAAAKFDPQHYGERIAADVRVGFISLDEAIHQLK